MVHAQLHCIFPECDARYTVDSDANECKECKGLLDVRYTGIDASTVKELAQLRRMNNANVQDRSGVWRFRHLLPFYLEHSRKEQNLVSLDGMEGNTWPIHVTRAAEYAGVPSENVWFQFEGNNPTGSFKDNGMAAAFTHAKMLGRTYVACASTGNTSASVAAFAANELNQMRAAVFIGDGKIARGKLAKTLAYDPTVLQIEGDFDDAMARVLEVSSNEGIYLMNSVNPFRLEGQKTIMHRVWEGLDWNVPDWVVVPGGNLGNCSAFGKAWHELYELGLTQKMPRIAVINAQGANMFYQLVQQGACWNGGKVNREHYRQAFTHAPKAHTRASAIEINRPVNFYKALRMLEWTNGVVREATDAEMLEAQAVVTRNGYGCEPASAATLAGIKKLREEGLIKKTDRVVGIFTGHLLNDAEALIEYHTSEQKNLFSNQPVRVQNSLDRIVQALR
ncbi:threonine synthase [Candidatus Pacearchaeota archaeon]|nr:threonine synthase [Candidatus Pacearchaeota archaeon]